MRHLTQLATWLALTLTILLPGAAAAREPLLTSGSTWRYYNEGEAAPSGWEEVGFDDSGWDRGVAQLGFGEGDEATVITRGSTLTYRTAYFRTSFQVADLTGATGVVMDLLADKGAIVYLNGAEVYRANMQPRQLSRYAAFAVGTTRDWTEGIAVDIDRLRTGTNVIAVETHQDEPTASTLSFDARLEIVRAGEAALVNGPWVTEVRETSARVMWETDAPTDTALDYGTTGAYGQRAVGRNGTTLHTVTLTGLNPGTTYHYQVRGSTGPLLGDARFRTAPLEGRPFTMLVYGDNRSNPDRHAAVVNAAVAHEPDLVLTTGDHVEAGQLWSAWQEQFFRPAASLLRQAAILPVVGNHESEILHPGSWFWEYFPNGEAQNWYSRRYGDVEIFVVDTSHAHGRASRQVAWLEQALASSTAPVLIVAHHYPVWSSGKHGSDPFAVGALLPLYERYGVSLVLNGHDHLYERSYKDGVNYLLVGGGGAGLYEPHQSFNPWQVVAEETYCFAVLDYDGDGTFQISSYRQDGSLIETLSVGAAE